VPLEDGNPYSLRPDGSSIAVLFDAVDTFLWGSTALEATGLVFDRWANLTSNMAKMNPGLDVHHHPVNPPLIGQMGC
jgi:hypothetical protein